jgi:hypothetical protein
MKFNVLFTFLVTILMTTGSTVIAGPGDKGKGSVVIEHTNGSDDGEGSVEIEVSLPAALSHLDKHTDDCVIFDETGTIQGDDCDPVVEIVE